MSVKFHYISAYSKILQPHRGVETPEGVNQNLNKIILFLLVKKKCHCYGDSASKKLYIL